MRLPAEPLFFKPVYKETIWGGGALRTRFNRPLPAGMRIGESWEVSGAGSDPSAVVRGPLAGMTLDRLAAEASRELLGERLAAGMFPLLFKIIDACERLSVQVHPDDAQAREYGWGANGKTECWYVIDARENARIVAGFREEVTREQISRAIEADSLDLLLNAVPIKSGDVLFIPAGTVHAVFEETLLYEVQQTSDTTLRLYDWGRLGADGKGRPLHLREALLAVDTHARDHRPLTPVVLDEKGCTHAYLSACRYFALERYAFQAEADIAFQAKQSFSVLTVINGTVRLTFPAGKTELSAGTTVLLPACLRDVRASGAAGAEFLLSSVPDLANEIVAPLRKQGVPDDAIKGIGGFPEKNDLIPLLKKT
jgi:mannose-6-phosphate isomerase